MLYLSGSFNYNTDFMRVEVKRLTYFVGASQVVLVVKNLPANAGDIRDAGLIPGSGRFPLEKKMTTHSSILAWRISGTEEPCGLVFV